MTMLARRKKTVALQWDDMCGLLRDTAAKHGLWYRELPPKTLGEPALCSLTTSRKHLSLILHPDGELRVTYRALTSFENVVCNILDIQESYVRELSERFP